MKHKGDKDIQQEDVSYRSLASVHMIAAAKYKWYYNVGSDCMQTHQTHDELEEDYNMEECGSCYTCLYFLYYHDVLVHF
jgi:polyferredoxin